MIIIAIQYRLCTDSFVSFPNAACECIEIFIQQNIKQKPCCFEENLLKNLEQLQLLSVLNISNNKARETKK